MRRHHDTVVIGAGVFGSWCALQLCRAGRSVLLLDGYGPGNSRSSSGGESRIIRMGYGADEIYTRWSQRALNLWKELFAETNQNLFHCSGVLWLAQDEDEYPIKCADTLANVGIPHEKLSPTEVLARFPSFDLHNITWALFEPTSGALLARRAVQAVTELGRNLGVNYATELIRPPGEPSSSVNGKLRYIISAAGERIEAERFVFACGPWLPKLFPELLGERIRPTRQEVFFFGVPQSVKRLKLPIWLDFKDEAYGFPDLEGRGVKVAIDRHGPLFDPDQTDRITSPAGLREARRYLTRRLPSMAGAVVTETRVCQYENTSSGDFLIDRHPAFENVLLVGGGSGHGFKHGPVVGEYVARLIEGRRDIIEPRFSLAAKATIHSRTVF